MNVHLQNAHVLPCGALLELDRDRSHGILREHELAFCRDADIPIAYDPVQSGWVPILAKDDLHRITKERSHKARSLSELNLTLRPWQSGDVDRFRDLLDDPRIWEHMPEPYPDPLTSDMADALIHIANNSNHHKVLAILQDDEPVGQVRVKFDSGESNGRTAEISYWIGRAWWRKGIASAAVTAFANRCLQKDPNIMSLTARVKTGNTASFRVLKKAGFVLDGPDGLSGWHQLKRGR